MTILLGILLLLAGIILPLAFLVWLSNRLNRPPMPRPRQLGLWLAFNFVLPVGLILTGLRLISVRVAASAVARDVATAALVGGAILAAGVIVEGVVARRAAGAGGDHGA